MYYGISRESQPREVAIYARVSTEHEAQLSALGNQLDWYKPIMAEHKNWHLVEKYVDEGITGTSATKRPKFMKMIRDAKKHKFDLIITREVARFARNTVDTLQYTRMLRSFGVEVFFINDNIKTFDGDGELRLTIMATLAQDESRKTSIRVKAGQQTSMENGVLYGNGNILGYDRVGRNEFVVNPEQAKTVRIIYDMYLSGHGLMQIRYELERQGRLTAKGKTRWYETVISHVLNNPFYCGIIKYHKQYTPDFLEQKKIKNDGSLEYTYVRGNHPTIVSEDEYRRVQAIMNQKRNTKRSSEKTGSKPRGHAPTKTVWSRLLECECGKSLNRHVWNRSTGAVNSGYLCYSQTNHGTILQRKNHEISIENCCSTPMLPEWKLQMIAVMIFQSYISNVDKVMGLANDMLAAHIADADDNDNNAEEVAEKQQELSRVKKKLDNLIEMRSEGEITREIFLDKSSALNGRIDELEDTICSLLEESKREPERDWEAELAFLKSELEKYVDFQHEGTIPESLIEAYFEKIVVHKTSMEWHLRTTPQDNADLQRAETILEIDEPEPPREHRVMVLASFTITKEDALKYVYSLNSRKRVHNWKDLEIQICA